MWELDYKESWAPKNWCFWTVLLEKTLENLLDSKEIQPVHPKGNRSWILFGRTDAEAPILWPCNVKNWLTGKDPDAGKDWEQKEKGATEDEMVGWHHLLNGQEFEQTLGDSEAQGNLACCSLWGLKSQTQLSNWTATGESAVKTLSANTGKEKEMATYSSILAWKISWTEEPGRLQSKGLQRVRHNWAIEHTHIPIISCVNQTCSSP